METGKVSTIHKTDLHAGILIGSVLLAMVGVGGPKGAEGATPPKRGDQASTTTKNLLVNGDFEKGKDSPSGWETLKRPGLEWVDVGGRHGRVLRMRLDRPTARTTGLMYHSQPIPVEQGQTYGIKLQIKSMGPRVIVFVKGYANVRGEEREIYRRKRQSRLPTGEWGIFETTFTPRSPMGAKALRHRNLTLPIVDRVNVMLYAYHPEGMVEFDNVAVWRVKEKGKQDRNGDRARTGTVESETETP